MPPNGEPPPAAAPEIPSEGSLRGSFIAILTPVFALVAGAIAAKVAAWLPGVELDQNQIVAFMIAVTTSVLTASYKWAQGWQQHEQRVSEKKAMPVKQAS
jgi:hypothetical protein